MIRGKRSNTPVMGSLLLLALLQSPAASPATSAQSRSNRLEFEVASIKENRQDVPWQDTRDNCGLNGMGDVNILRGGRLTAQRALLACIIQGAYVVRPFQLVGGPAWANSVHFDIEARAAERNATPEETRLMLQALLADRFKLRFHKETRNIPTYSLAIAKAGTKLRPAPAGSCGKPGSLPTSGFPEPPAPGQPPAPMNFPCGRLGGVGSPAGSRMDGREVPIAELVRLLSLQLKLPIIDKTGLKGTFDIHLTYLDTNRSTSPDARESPADFGLTLFDALEKELGLKLEALKAPADVLVIDSVHEPTPN